MFASDLVLAAFLLLAALVTGLAALFGRWYISMPMVFVLAGIVLGPEMAGLLEVSPTTEVVQFLAELTLAMILFADASGLDLQKVSDDAVLPARLLVVALPLIILLGGLVGKLLYPSAGVASLLLVAAILAPTDASLGLPIYTNPVVPVRIRRALNIESGLNDGIVSPVVILFLGLILSGEGVLFGDWLTVALREVGLAIVVGTVAGYVGGAFLEAAVDRHWTSPIWAKLAILALALASFFLAQGVGGNGFVAAFVGGIVFGHASGHKLREEREFVEAAGTLLAMMVWTVFAAVFITPQLAELAMAFDGRAIFYAVFSLTVVRMLPVALSMWGTGIRRDTVLIMGWFGPRGLASVVFGLLAAGAFMEDGLEIQPFATIVTTTILFSVFAHGISARPLLNWYARRLEQAESAQVELQEMPEMKARRQI